MAWRWKSDKPLSTTSRKSIVIWHFPHKGPVTRKMFLFDDVIMFFWSTTKKDPSAFEKYYHTVDSFSGTKAITISYASIAYPKSLTCSVKNFQISTDAQSELSEYICIITDLFGYEFWLYIMIMSFPKTHFRRGIPEMLSSETPVRLRLIIMQWTASV